MGKAFSRSAAGQRPSVSIVHGRKVNRDPVLPFIYVRKNEYGTGIYGGPMAYEGTFEDFTNRVHSVGHVWMADNQGLRQDTHPSDKVRYAERVFGQMMRVYAAGTPMREGTE